MFLRFQVILLSAVFLCGVTSFVICSGDEKKRQHKGLLWAFHPDAFDRKSTSSAASASEISTSSKSREYDCESFPQSRSLASSSTLLSPSRSRKHSSIEQSNSSSLNINNNYVPSTKLMKNHNRGRPVVVSSSVDNWKLKDINGRRIPVNQYEEPVYIDSYGQTTLLPKYVSDPVQRPS